ncbi:hypothetical protein DIZ81_06025 [Legionella taurinensis]|uniref:Uncharacterized protein n=1 Tax=Legionella taurinensis TaxID=70611 RepID=A0A3A5LF15_9GAMM|nr:hypothetical protein [Legionella taurinensis]MDX1837474.1 hypothetical protein [Legionella taurinensis]PUT40818.1 hypothetical protein DB744_06025 [Legionella taurinensis]PUT44239.1 hypothetical protein DB746_04425 [Legionella taurinensis]PUT47541.1 hypothetical protein DB743_02595 [Legionella taurinensis]PUT48680.1 hypothetical protein DB745_04425 [Legionella taurinensis]
MDFKKNFTRQFLMALLAILSDVQEMKKARAGYTQQEKDERRYNCQASFGLKNWDKETAVDFSATVFEALARASEHFVNHVQMVEQVQMLNEHILKELVPGLIKGLDCNQPLDKVRDVITQRIESMKEPSLANNPYVFYGGLAATALAAVAVVALLPSNGPRQ